jgi:hypothetical protein
MAFDTSMHRLIDRTKDVQMADYISGLFAFFLHHLNSFIQVAFFDAQDAENVFLWPLTTCNITSSIETKSFFKTPRIQIMRAQAHSPT